MTMLDTSFVPSALCLESKSGDDEIVHRQVPQTRSLNLFCRFQAGFPVVLRLLLVPIVVPASYAFLTVSP